MWKKTRTIGPFEQKTLFVLSLLLLLFTSSLFTAFVIFGISEGEPHLSAYGDSWDDVSNFRGALVDRGLDVSNIVSSPNLLDSINTTHDITKTVFISIGVEKKYTLSEANAIYNFFARGGKVIIADDFGYGNSISNREFFEGSSGFGVEFSNSPLFDGRYVKNPLFVTVPIKSLNVDYDFSGTHLFTLSSDYVLYLANGPILTELKDAFELNGIELSSACRVSHVSVNEWFVTDVDLYDHYREYRITQHEDGMDIYSYTVVFNQPSAFIPHAKSSIKTIARSSPCDPEDNFPQSWLDLNGNGERELPESSFARTYSNGFPLISEVTTVSDEGYRGRIIFISDPSLFINDMWNYNSGFCTELVNYMLGDEAVSDGGCSVIFDESRHNADNIVASFRQEFYQMMVVLFTDTNLRVLVPVVILMVLLIIIIAVDGPVRRRHVFNIDFRTIYNLKNPRVRSVDAQRVRELFRNKIRLSLGLSRDNFDELDIDELEGMVGDMAQVEFLLGVDPETTVEELENTLVFIRDWQPNSGRNNRLD